LEGEISLQTDVELALIHAVDAELAKEAESSSHKTMKLSVRKTCMSNGIWRCSVQVECLAGCGYLVEAFGDDADILLQRAVAIQNKLNEKAQKDLQKNTVDVLQY
jgi:hypothetical protein